MPAAGCFIVMRFIIVGYVEGVDPPLGILLGPGRFAVVAAGRCALNALAAWVTRAVRSARNSAQPSPPPSAASPAQ